jgi:hypothetical protein
LRVLLIVTFIVGLDFATDFHMSKHPVTVVIAFLILIFVVCPLFTLWFVSIELKDDKPRETSPEPPVQPPLSPTLGG